MYAYGEVMIDRHNVVAVPLECVVEVSNENVCYVYEGDKAIQVPLQTGISDGKWVEITRKRVDNHWVALTGSEDVIQGDLPGD